MLKNSSRSKKLLATNSSHSGSAAAALSPLTSWAAAAGSRAAANQRQAALATPFSFATSTPPPPHTTNPHKYKRGSQFTSESIFHIFMDTLNVQENPPVLLLMLGTCQITSCGWVIGRQVVFCSAVSSFLKTTFPLQHNEPVPNCQINAPPP